MSRKKTRSNKIAAGGQPTGNSRYSLKQGRQLYGGHKLTRFEPGALRVTCRHGELWNECCGKDVTLRSRRKAVQP